MIDPNHEGYAGRASAQLRIPQSSTEAMTALGELFAGTMADPDDEDRCESGLPGYAVHGLVIDDPVVVGDPVPDPDRVSQLMVDLEASILAARSKREEAKAVADGLFRQAFGRNP